MGLGQEKGLCRLAWQTKRPGLSRRAEAKQIEHVVFGFVSTLVSDKHTPVMGASKTVHSPKQDISPKGSCANYRL